MSRFLKNFVFVTIILCFLGTAYSTSNEPDFSPVANEVISSSGIGWTVKVNCSQLEVTIKRPDGQVILKTFPSGSSPYLNITEIIGQKSIEGNFSYELQAIPYFKPKVRDSSNATGQFRDNTQLGAFQEPLRQTGYFLVRDGMIVKSNLSESNVSIAPGNISRAMDEVIYDDLIVDGSLCVGNDCYSGYAFGFDTIALLENNLRIFFDDTSNTSSFPRNDWRIVINDTIDGGGAYFALQDVTGGKTPFTVEAGAKTNSLYVDDDGQVGIGTSSPVFEMHIKEGDTPTVRLHQDSSYGWPEQIWDVGGNETSFFIRDGTHAARLPFRIEPETPSSTLCLKSDGKVGIGTWSPGYPVEVQTTGTNAIIVAERTSGAVVKMGATSNQAQFGSISNHPLKIVANNSTVISVNQNGTLDMSDGGSYDGTWNPACSRDLKENIKNLSADEAMVALVGLQPVKYNYKKSKEESRVGFIAEDVPELVAMNGRKKLSTLDIVAVLTKVVQQQQKNAKRQEEKISQLQKRIEELEKR